MRRALITGASSGIGAATARLLAQAGYRVALLARREDKLTELLGSLPGEGHLAHAGDVSDERSMAPLWPRLVDEWHGLDLAVNNAGIGYRARVETIDGDLVDRVLATNVKGAMLVAKAALPLLRRGENPVLVNVSSVVGRRGVPEMAVYAASKAALHSLGETLRIEWARDRIRVCTLAPGMTDTGFFAAELNPTGLQPLDGKGTDSAESVARAILALDQKPRPEWILKRKWRVLTALAALSPRLGDRMLMRKLPGDWRPPTEPPRRG